VNLIICIYLFVYLYIKYNIIVLDYIDIMYFVVYLIKERDLSIGNQGRWEMNKKASSKLLYIKISKDILDYINREKPTIIPTELEMMDKYQVSRTTIRKALEILKEKKIIKSTRRKGTLVTNGKYECSGYILAIMQHYSKSEKFQKDIFNYFFAKLSQYGIEIKIHMLGENDEFDSNLISKQALSAKGIIIGDKSQGLPELYQILNPFYNKTVLLLAEPRFNYKYVNGDRFLGFKKISEHLAGLGHRKIVSTGPVSDLARREGIKEGLKAFNFTIRPELEINCLGYRQNGYLAAKELIEKKVDFSAVIAHNDYSALGIMERLLQEGYNIPQDISIVSYDNLLESDKYTIPLTSCGIDRDKIVETTLDMIFSKEHHVKVNNMVYGKIIKPDLFVRESTGQNNKVL